MPSRGRKRPAGSARRPSGGSRRSKVLDGQMPRRKPRRSGRSGGRSWPSRTRQPPWRGCASASRRSPVMKEPSRPRRTASSLRRGRLPARSPRCLASPTQGARRQARHSPRSTSGGHARTQRSSWFAVASRASGRRLWWRRTRWWQRHSESRQAAPASHSFGVGSRSRSRRAGCLYGKLGSSGRRSSEPPLRQPSGRR